MGSPKLVGDLGGIADYLGDETRKEFARLGRKDSAAVAGWAVGGVGKRMEKDRSQCGAEGHGVCGDGRPAALIVDRAGGAGTGAVAGIPGVGNVLGGKRAGERHRVRDSAGDRRQIVGGDGRWAGTRGAARSGDSMEEGSGAGWGPVMRVTDGMDWGE